MYYITVKKPASAYEVGELAKMFLEREMFEITEEDNPEEAPSLSYDRSFSVVLDGKVLSREPSCFEYGGPVAEADRKKSLKNLVKRGVYDALSRETGKTLPWGILTGVKPVKIVRELSDRGLDESTIKQHMMDYYLVSGEKTDLLMEILRVQNTSVGVPYRGTAEGHPGVSQTGEAVAGDGSRAAGMEQVGIYLGIPFCPSRCIYCSFTSNVAKTGEIERYLDALYKEIDFVSDLMKERNLGTESFYIGGGTPTTLTEVQLDRLLDRIFSKFGLEGLKEFTVEAGRPDTITKEKLEVIKSYGIGRISINPQSMNSRTLEAIGRLHSPEEIVASFDLAREAGIEVINTDLIAGLPGESPEDFRVTLDAVLALKPENITVHTLALKRASRLREEDSSYNYKEVERLGRMVEMSAEAMKENGYRPYYLYRQKYMAGNFENVGYAKPGTECIFNVRTMEEKQSMIALGAGGISKRFFPEENRIERAANVSNYEIYIERLQEMLGRKKNLFAE